MRPGREPALADHHPPEPEVADDPGHEGDHPYTQPGAWMDEQCLLVPLSQEMLREGKVGRCPFGCRAMARFNERINSYDVFLRVVLSHARECSFIKKWDPDHAFLYVIFEEIKTSIKISVVPPRLRENRRTACLDKEEVVMDGSDPMRFDWRYLETPLLNLHRAPAEEIVQDEGDNLPGPSMHQRNVRESPDDQRLPMASTRRRTHRGPAHKGASDGGTTKAHTSRAAAPINTPAPTEAAGRPRGPKRQARDPTSEPESGNHNRLPLGASKRSKVAAQHEPAGAPADQQQAPHGGMQLNDQLNVAALDAATVVMHMYRTAHGM